MIRRVLMTADAVGGVWTYALELARALAERHVEVLLAVMGPAPSSKRRKVAEQIPHLTLEHQPFALEWMEHPWADVWRAGDWLLSLEAKWRPDVIHLSDYAHASCPFEAPRLVVAHSCVCSWHEAVRGGPLPDKWSIYRRRVTGGLAAADVVVAPTRWMLDQLEQHYGAPRSGEVIPNARLADGFFPARNKEPIVFAAGRVWDEAKNLLVLDRAAEALSWPVMIAGATHYQGGPTGTFSRAHLLGELEPAAIAGWMARAAIYALPARYEPFGLSVLEAALSGCALVLGDIPSLREIWSGAALFVDPNSPEQLSSAINRLIAEPSLREDLARRACGRAVCFSPRAQADAYLATYESIIAQRRPACAS